MRQKREYRNINHHEKRDNILNRRIVYPAFFFKGDAQEAIKRLLMENLIDPINPIRKWPNAEFLWNDELPKTDIYIEFDGIDLEMAVVRVCEMSGLILYWTDEKIVGQTIFTCKSQKANLTEIDFDALLKNT